MLGGLVEEDDAGEAARRGGELGVAQEQLGAGVVEDVADLLGGEPVVDRAATRRRGG